MQDFLKWSLPLFRVFGIRVRLHLLYIMLTLALIWRTVANANNPNEAFNYILIWVVVLFISILLHEFGHCFAARAVNGDADEILMWPLGGLASCDVPHTPYANFITAIGGPLVTLAICAISAIILFFNQLMIPLNPFDNRSLASPELYSFKSGKYSVPADEQPIRVVRAGTDESNYGPIIKVGNQYFVIDVDTKKVTEVDLISAPTYPNWVAWVARIFFLNYILFLFNLIPAFPMDGGRVFQTFMWSRTNYHTAMVRSCYLGMICAAIFIIISIAYDNFMLSFLALFIFYHCQKGLITLEQSESEGLFGYDFSQGYTSLEAGEERSVRKKSPGWFARWSAARKERKRVKEEETKLQELSRMDELLEKVHNSGLQSLTDEERRFMTRVSNRYRQKK